MLEKLLIDEQEWLIDKCVDTRYDYESWLPAYQKTFQKLAELNPKWFNFKKVLDCGCGYGASTLAIGHVLPKSQIYAISLVEKPLSDVKKQLDNRLHFKYAKIADYLYHSKEEFDLVLFIRIPFSDISEVKDYNLLYSRVTKGGFVLMLGDSSLKDHYMQSVGFKSLGFPKEPDTLLYRERGLWMK